ncbi:hypothetical protein EZS27_019507 [termite gut metagenome]|uniref:Rad50/SbcC-type AAA domain-containing protein n=1 Tax=termite gut metagenome TaxID=433724 RepID=A0A5J4RDZ0_9ZZZZ
MKKLNIKLNQAYKLFKNGFEQELEGDLVILSGVNGSGKSQFINMLNMITDKVPADIRNQNDLAKYKINVSIKIDSIEITNIDIAKRTFKDNINITILYSVID